MAPVGEHGHVTAGSRHGGLGERHRVLTGRHLSLRGTVDALGSKKITGSGSSMDASRRPLASWALEGITTLRPGMQTEMRFWVLGVVVPALDTAANWHADHHARGVFAAGAVAVLREFLTICS